MAADHDHSANNSSATHEQAQRPADPGLLTTTEFAPDAAATVAPGTILANPNIGGRGNAPVRSATLQRLQRTVGNRATRRFVQRAAASSAPAQPSDIGERIQAKAGGGTSLDTGVQRQLESGLGADLSGVRVHTDGEADHLARSVDAVAFTTGADIFFRNGAYNPGSADGMHLLAHEAAHTVQQAAGPVAGTPTDAGVSISDPSDADEQAAERAAAAATSAAPPSTAAESASSAGGASEAAPVAAQRATDGDTIQRYQAGDAGHGGIEEKALTAAGFNASEVGEIYFGNWCRDLSQLSPKLLPIINLLSLGEFNHEVSANDLGTYVPSEHLDNPEGGGTIEDPRIQALKTSSDPKERAQFDAALAKLSPEQRKAYDQEEAHRKEIGAAAAANHLPVYIERGKMHAKQKLADAISKRATPEGRALMGDALHAIEDYFSHSNFTEAGIYLLYREGNPTVAPLVRKMADTTLGPNSALAGGAPDAQGRPQIITGTYANGANDWVSRLELLKTEIENGQLRKALALGILRKAGITGNEVGRAVARYTVAPGMGVAGAVGGAAVGTVTGAAEGAAEGWNRHSGLSAVGHAITGFFGGAAEGAAEGASEGYQAGEQLGEDIGGAVGSAAAQGTVELAAIVAKTDIAVLCLAFPIIPATIAGLVALADKVLIDKLAEDQTAKSATQAKAKGLTGPTHSQIAKDAPDNPLFGASVTLAQAADKEIGEAMRAAWSALGPAASGSATPSSGGSQAPAQGGQQAPPNGANGASAPASVTDPVTKLVDKFVCNPADNGWWRPILLGAAGK